MAATKQQIESVDKSFDPKKTSLYKLYIELSIEGIKMTVLHPESKTFIGFEEFAFDELSNDYAMIEPVKKAFKNSQLLSHNYKAVIVSIANNRATLIPNAIFKPDQLKAYHQFNYTTQEDDVFHSDHLINLNAHNVYTIPDYIVALFKGIQNVQFTHASSAFIEASLLQSKKAKALSAIWVNVMNNSFQLSVIKGQDLAFYNSFEYKTAEDFMYFLLFALDQLGIENDEANINLVGAINKESVVYTMLHQYIKSLQFGEAHSTLNRSYILEDTPKHAHFALFNQYLCE